jgi:hypothetical protein
MLNLVWPAPSGSIKETQGFGSHQNPISLQPSDSTAFENPLKITL